MEMEEMEQSSRYRKYKKFKESSVSMTGMTAIGPVLTFWLISVSNLLCICIFNLLLTQISN